VLEKNFSFFQTAKLVTDLEKREGVLRVSSTPPRALNVRRRNARLEPDPPCRPKRACVAEVHRETDAIGLEHGHRAQLGEEPPEKRGIVVAGLLVVADDSDWELLDRDPVA